MSKTINCFVPFASAEQAKATVEALKASEQVKNVYLLKTEDAEGAMEGCETIEIKSLYATETIKKIAEKADADFVLLYTKYDTAIVTITPYTSFLVRMFSIPFRISIIIHHPY